MIPYHLVDGEGEPVVLINSLGATLDMWAPQFEPFSSCFRLVRMDTRGHGATADAPGPWTVDDLADDVDQMLDGLGIARAHLVGISMGAAIAMTAALRHPERVGRLVLISAAPRFGTERSWRDRAAAVRADGTASLADGAMDRWFTGAFHREHPQTVAEFRDRFAGIDAEGYARCCDALADFDLRGHLAGIDAETLVVYGTEDETTTGDDARAIADEVGLARVEAVADAKHMVATERPDEVNDLVIDFLTTELQRPGQAD